LILIEFIYHASKIVIGELFTKIPCNAFEVAKPSLSCTQHSTWCEIAPWSLRIPFSILSRQAACVLHLARSQSPAASSLQIVHTKSHPPWSLRIPIAISLVPSLVADHCRQPPVVLFDFLVPRYHLCGCSCSFVHVRFSRWRRQSLQQLRTTTTRADDTIQPANSVNSPNVPHMTSCNS